MKVLFISHEATRTGAPLVLLSLLRSIKQRQGIDFELLLLEDGILHKDFAALSRVILPKKKKTLARRIVRKLSNNSETYPIDYSFLDGEKYDCIFANTIASLPVAATIKQIINKPLLLYVHESQFFQDYIGISEENLRLCDNIIAVSNKVKKDLITLHGIAVERICVIHPFSPFSEEIKPTPTSSSSNFLTIGMAGTASWTKGIDLLPLVIKSFTTTYPNIECRFVWVGEIDELTRKRLFHDAKHLRVEDKMYFIPCQDNPIPEYSRFDVFLLLSREDSFPLVCLENAMLGNPIVCMDGASGITDFIGNDAGIIVPYMDFGEISKALYTLHTNKDYSASLAKKAQETAFTKFSKEQSVDNIINLIDTCYKPCH